MNKYTYRKSDGEDIWTVGHDEDGKWITESDWESELYAFWRVTILNDDWQSALTSDLINSLRIRIEEMHEGYRAEFLKTTTFSGTYCQGAADACGLILDLPELRLFLPAKDGGE